MAGNKSLAKAKEVKNDEFYTQISDIENELKYYKEHFKNKIIFCNCDDPTYSNFWRYFHLKFSELGLKKLISTHYDIVSPTYKLEYKGGDDSNIEAGDKTPLTQNGDFRSPECIDLLKEADIVVTNPPFSLFREYVAQLMKYEKKFIIIGSMNAITYKEFFPLIKDNKVWLGYSSPKKFVQPNGKTKNFGNIYWYTNLDHKKRHETMILFRSYKDEPERYPKYDNYDAINVDKVVDIPMDYFEHIGVPISFLDKYCPEQFEIIGCTESEGTGLSNGLFTGGGTPANGPRDKNLQENLHSQKIKITRYIDGSAKILPQNNIDLRELAKQYIDKGFVYCSGVMGVPITFLDKYCPEQFEIVSFRKSDNGKDLVFTREREREFNYTFEFLFNSINETDCGYKADDLQRKKELLCSDSNTSEDIKFFAEYICSHPEQIEIALANRGRESIETFFKFDTDGVHKLLLNDKEPFKRILIRQRQIYH